MSCYTPLSIGCVYRDNGEQFQWHTRKIKGQCRGEVQGADRARGRQGKGGVEREETRESNGLPPKARTARYDILHETTAWVVRRKTRYDDGKDVIAADTGAGAAAQHKD